MTIKSWQMVLNASIILIVSSAGAQDLVQPQIVKIPMKGGGIFGSDVEMVSHLYRPDGEGPFPTVIFSHGRSSADHWNLKNPVSVGHGNFWLRKGFALVAPVRPGYGDTGGVDRENAGGNWRNGRCMGYPDYAKVAKIAGESVLTTLDWVRGQPWARTDKVLLVG